MIRNLINLVLFICVLVQNVQALYSAAKQDKLNAVISETIAENIDLFPLASSAASTSQEELPMSRVRSLCSDLQPSDPDWNRVGCCQHSKMKILYNMQLRNGTFEAMYDNSDLSEKGLTLPVLNAMRIQKLIRMRDVNNFVKSRRPDSALMCTEYFNGTLHIATDRTYHKLYHAVGDNYAPAVSQVLLDALLDRPFLRLPRMQLHIANNGREDPSPYMSLLNFLFSAGTRTTSQLNGWCFRRVIWGPGPYVFYNDQRVALRRMVADFARRQVQAEYSLAAAVPKEFTMRPPVYPHFASVYRASARASAPSPHTYHPPRKPRPPSRLTPKRQLSPEDSYRYSNISNNNNNSSNNNSSSSSSSSSSSNNISSNINSDSGDSVWHTTIPALPAARTSTGRTRLRIVLYSRGNEGTRSLKLESSLMTAIGEKFEAYTAICCDFSRVSMQQQIAYAFHADMVIGLHGAALVHGIFARRGLVMIEFKMQYAFTSVLFPVVTDSRAGRHAVLDTREYFYVRGQRLPPGARMPDGAIDSRLINRTTALMAYTLDLDPASTAIHRNDPSRFPRDFVFNSMALHTDQPSSPAYKELGHVLGPLKTQDITQNCRNMILSRARNEIFLSHALKGNRTGSSASSNSIHCPVCYED